MALQNRAEGVKVNRGLFEVLMDADEILGPADAERGGHDMLGA